MSTVSINYDTVSIFETSFRNFISNFKFNTKLFENYVHDSIVESTDNNDEHSVNVNPFVSLLLTKINKATN